MKQQKTKSNAGRKPVRKDFKRETLHSARLPNWLIEWLTEQGKIGKRIELALIDYFDIPVPEGYKLPIIEDSTSS